jgi:hypothetical protein
MLILIRYLMDQIFISLLFPIAKFSLKLSVKINVSYVSYIILQASYVNKNEQNIVSSIIDLSFLNRMLSGYIDFRLCRGKRS